jgi:hypothetical protein
MKENPGHRAAVIENRHEKQPKEIRAFDRWKIIDVLMDIQ